jgi:hypothetical protein
VSTQLDFFNKTAAPDTSLIGLPVQLPDPCRCGSTMAAIDVGCVAHRAGLRCACGRHRGWVSGVSHKFVTETVKRFGRPTQPIQIRAPQARMMTASSGADVS